MSVGLLPPNPTVKPVKKNFWQSKRIKIHVEIWTDRRNYISHRLKVLAWRPSDCQHSWDDRFLFLKNFFYHNAWESDEGTDTWDAGFCQLGSPIRRMIALLTGSSPDLCSVIWSLLLLRESLFGFPEDLRRFAPSIVVNFYWQGRRKWLGARLHLMQTLYLEIRKQ